MRHLVMGTVLLLAAWPAAGAPEDKDQPKPDKPATPAVELKALTGEYEKAFADMSKQIRDAKTAKEAEKIVETRDQLQEDYGKRVLAFVDKHADDPDAVVDALIW